ncbi:DNA polymerase III subunit beta [Mycolicibacterium fortuitum]|uniref:DNA polymerase III subunit beta n=1 Tax=Mycolicibacterium fortuitum TaxID=1766 RepID=UPI00260DB15E|nr:DNA polymerase III subunit beta [Mycolicibacterium fortuitum]
MTDLQFTAPREDFTQAVAWVARSLPTKPLTPIWAGIRLTAMGGDVLMSAFDSETSAEVTCSAEFATDGGVSVVSGRLLATIAKVLPKKPVQFRHEGTVAQIVCGAAEFTLPTMNAAEYPQLPGMPEVIGGVEASAFADACARVTVAASKDEAVQKLSGVQLQWTPEGALRMAASDRYRVALLEMPWQGTLGDDPALRTALVPWKSLGDVGRLGDGDVRVAFDADGGVFGLAGGGRYVTTRVINEEFPNLWGALPGADRAKHRARIVVRDVAEAVGRALTVIQDEKQRLHLTFSGDGLAMRGGNTAGFGQWSEVVDVDYEALGQDNEIQFWVNPRYLLDGLNALPSDKATLDLTAYNQPIVMRPETTGYTHAVMPTKAPAGVAL